jgi:hypothetical protein
MPNSLTKTLTFGQYTVLIAIRQLMTADQLDLVTGFQRSMIKSYLHFLLSNQLIIATIETAAIRYELAEAGHRAIMHYEATNPELVIRQQAGQPILSNRY